jgi:hypothetical protein
MYASFKPHGLCHQGLQKVPRNLPSSRISRLQSATSSNFWSPLFCPSLSTCHTMCPLKLPLAIRVPSDIRLSTVSISCFEFSTAFTNKIEPCEFEIGQWRSCKKLYTKAHYRKQLHSCSGSCWNHSEAIEGVPKLNWQSSLSMFDSFFFTDLQCGTRIFR